MRPKGTPSSRSSPASASVDGLADFYRKLWARGDAGIEVRLTLLRDAATHDVTIKSEDRYDWLKLGHSY